MYQTQNQVQNKPTAAYWLTVIGGILGILVSLAIAALGVLAYIALASIGDYYGYYDYGAFGWGAGTTIGVGIWGMIASFLMIIFARKLNTNPMEHTKWGILILIFALIGINGFIGSILGFIGAILALVYKPIMVGAPQYAPPQPQYYGPPPQQAAYTPPQQPAARYCPQCGTLVQNGVRFCPNCGKQVN